MNHSPVLLPQGDFFPFWDDITVYTKTYHVACGHKDACDNGPGSIDRPFATIGQAARVLLPGEKAIVHAGTYRECIRPHRGGTGPERMIAYETAPGETVRVLGSERLSKSFSASSGWQTGTKNKTAKIWQADFPAQWFMNGYNPFLISNFTSEYMAFVKNWTETETVEFLLRRGGLFANGLPLQQVLKPRGLGDRAGTFWVEDPGLRIHFRLWDDADPNLADIEMEATVREQVFAPTIPGLGYIRVSGFNFSYSADGFPIPQRAMVSAYRGHHWIIESNHVRWANACGIDIGNESWYRGKISDSGENGHHILRRNIVSDCGICGIAGVDNNAYTLVEDNVIERVAEKPIERLWETAGLKFHNCRGVLIRHNVFRHIRHASALWLDFLISNSRVTQNLVYDVESLHGGIMIEASREPNWIDRNVLWNIRGVTDIWNSTSGVTGPGINIDTSEKCLIAHNFLGNIRDEYAISVHLAQPDRIVAGSAVTGRKNRVLNNILANCPKRIQLCVKTDNESNGNWFDTRDQNASLSIRLPAPASILNLPSWQEHHQLDLLSVENAVAAEFDEEKMILRFTVDPNKAPKIQPIPELDAGKENDGPGPWSVLTGDKIFTFFAGPQSMTPSPSTKPT